MSADQSSTPCSQDELTQPNGSAMFTLWNLVADLIETQEQKTDQQQQISDFYGKVATTLPRLACLMQLYFNAMSILDRVKNFVIFSEGDNHQATINQDFITSVEQIIKTEYHKYDQNLLLPLDLPPIIKDPLVVVEKEAVVAASIWYQHHLNTAETLFTIDMDFSSTSTDALSSTLLKSKSLKELIMLLDMNIFPMSAITLKHPLTGCTYVSLAFPTIKKNYLLNILEELSKIGLHWGNRHSKNS